MQRSDNKNECGISRASKEKSGLRGEGQEGRHGKTMQVLADSVKI